MFEYLKGLDLPAFDLDNWKSAIRDRVAVHPDYIGLDKFTDRAALADIEYTDVSGGLTKFLIAQGLLNQAVWDTQTVHYHIEVKATTLPDWQEPFYMSKAQKRHVSRSQTQSNMHNFRAKQLAL